MKDKIVSIIKEQKVINFPDLYKELTLNSLDFSKPSLRNAIDSLEHEGIVISAFGNIYDPTELPNAEGYVQWTMTGFCWLDNKDKSNEYGISVEAPEDALQIYNKKSVNMSCTSQGKIIENNEKKFFVSTSCSVPMKNLKTIYIKDNKGYCYQLNNENTCSLPIKNTLDLTDYIGIAVYDVEKNEINHVENIGLLSSKGIESKIAYLMAELKPAPQFEPNKILGNEIKNLNNKRFFTIDSKNTKDRDDAICVEKSNDGYSIFVAISDVSSFIQKGTIEDDAAKKAGSTFYLHHEVVHMLSRNIAEDYCSLNPGVEKNALICQLNFNNQYKIQDSSFYQGTIISKACLTYDDVDRLFNNQPMIESTVFNERKELPALKADLALLSKIESSNPMNINRMERDYNRTELLLNEDGKVQAIIEEKEESTQSQKIVEFSMLHANIAAAKFIYDNYGYGIFRNQKLPIDIEKPKSAKYENNATGHWGLNIDFYTHFTSPIRRYCDLSVHRMIKAALEKKPSPYNPEELNSITSHLNYQQTNAKHAFLKVNGMLERQYLDSLVKNKQMAKNLDIIEVSETGMVFRNKQNIEFFMPEFKMSRGLQDFFNYTKDEENDSKKVASIRDKFKVLGFVDEYSWLDGRKNGTYHVTEKVNDLHPKMSKNCDNN